MLQLYNHLVKVKHIFSLFFLNQTQHNIILESTPKSINAYKASLAIHFQQPILISYFWQPIDQDPLKIVVVQHCFVYKGFWQERN